MTDTPAVVTDSNIPTQPVVTEPIDANTVVTPVPSSQFTPIPNDSGSLPAIPVVEQKAEDAMSVQPNFPVPQPNPVEATEVSGQASTEPSASVPATPQVEPVTKQPMIIKASKLSNNALRVFVAEYLKENNNDYKDALEQIQTIDELIEKDELTEEQLINNPIGL